MTQAAIEAHLTNTALRRQIDGRRVVVHAGGDAMRDLAQTLAAAHSCALTALDIGFSNWSLSHLSISLHTDPSPV